MARRGRKRKPGPRYPSGALVRAEIREDVRETVIETRMRQFGYSRERAKNDLAGFAIGRMALEGWFGASWLDALTAVQHYCEATADYMRLKCPQQPIPKAMDYLAGRGTSLAPEPSLKVVDRVEKRYLGMRNKLVNGVDGVARIRFHEAAYFDRVGGDECKADVVACVQVLMA